MKRIFFFFSFFLPAVLFSQDAALNFTQTTGSSDSLLNLYGSNIAVAYSVFQINSNIDTFGTCLCSNDNSQHQILFSGGVYDTAAVKTACGSNTAYLVRWFDQSGNAIHVLQTDTSKAPTIMKNGNIRYTPEGQLGIYADNSDGMNTVETTTWNQPNHIFCTYTKFNTTLAYIFNQTVGVPNTQRNILFGSNDTRLNAGTTLSSVGSITVNQTDLSEGLFSGTSSTIWINNTFDKTGNAGTQENRGVGLFSIQGNGTGSPYYGLISELLFYNADKSSDRASINSNINNRFNIY